MGRCSKKLSRRNSARGDKRDRKQAYRALEAQTSSNTIDCLGLRGTVYRTPKLSSVAYRRMQPSNFWARLRRHAHPLALSGGLPVGRYHGIQGPQIRPKFDFGPLAEGYFGDTDLRTKGYRVIDPADSFDDGATWGGCTGPIPLERDEMSREEPVTSSREVLVGVAAQTASPGVGVVGAVSIASAESGVASILLTPRVAPVADIVSGPYTPPEIRVSGAGPDDRLPDTASPSVRRFDVSGMLSPSAARQLRRTADPRNLSSPLGGSDSTVQRTMRENSFIALSPTRPPTPAPVLNLKSPLKGGIGIGTANLSFGSGTSDEALPSWSEPRNRDSRRRPLTDFAAESYGPREGNRKIRLPERSFPKGVPVKRWADSAACEKRRARSLARYHLTAKTDKVQHRASAIVRLVQDIDPAWMREFLQGQCKEVVKDTGCWLSVEAPALELRKAVDMSHVNHPILKRGDGSPMTFREVHIATYPRDPLRRTRSLAVPLYRLAIVAAGHGSTLPLMCEGGKIKKGAKLKRTHDASHWCLNPYCFCPEHLFPERVGENIQRNSCRGQVEIQMMDGTVFNPCPHVGGEMAMRCLLPVVWIKQGEANFIRANGKYGHTYEIQSETSGSFESRQNESTASVSHVGSWASWRTLQTDTSGSGERPWALRD
jgi:hypothetical protein